MLSGLCLPHNGKESSVKLSEMQRIIREFIDEFGDLRIIRGADVAKALQPLPEEDGVLVE